MSMTKKDYVLIAGVINSVMWEDHIDPLTIGRVATRLAARFQHDSDTFRNDLFLHECLKGQEK